MLGYAFFKLLGYWVGRPSYMFSQQDMAAMLRAYGRWTDNDVRAQRVDSGSIQAKHISDEFAAMRWETHTWSPFTRLPDIAPDTKCEIEDQEVFEWFRSIKRKEA